MYSPSWSYVLRSFPDGPNGPAHRPQPPHDLGTPPGPGGPRPGGPGGTTTTPTRYRGPPPSLNVLLGPSGPIPPPGGPRAPLLVGQPGAPYPLPPTPTPDDFHGPGGPRDPPAPPGGVHSPWSSS